MSPWVASSKATLTGQKPKTPQQLQLLKPMISKPHLILIGVGALAGFFVADSLILKDFNGGAQGVGFNPFARGYGYGFGLGSGTPVSF